MTAIRRGLLPPARPKGCAMADDWLLLSDRSGLRTSSDPVMVEAGLFVIELALPLTEAAVLLDHHASQGWARTFTLFHDPAAGLVLIHRQGGSVARHALPGPLPHVSGTGRLSLRFDAPARIWDMRFELLHAGDHPPLLARGRNPLPVRPEDLHALSLPENRVHRHSAVLWFGLTKGEALPRRAPWIGQRTPIATARGQIMAGNLRPGELICTADGGLLPLRNIRRHDLPACGSFAPVLLRAPFFGQSHDILVSSDQCLALSGPEVEYLFGEDEVLLAAGDIVDGRAALAEQRRSVASALALEFDHPVLLDADGCILLSARPSMAPPLRMLQPYEALTLLSLLGRAGHRRVA